MIHPLKYISPPLSTEFSIWMFSDIHNGVSPGELATAVGQIDSEIWDIGINIGDNMQPDDDGDTPYINYINELNNFINKDINKIYHIPGNHDRTKASDPAGADFYHKKYCSPFSADNSIYNGQPYTPQGDYQAFSLEVGNMLIVCMGDDNSGAQPGGEDGLGSGSFNFRASGNISSSQWTWFKNIIESNTDKIIIVVTHHGIKDTNIGMGWKEFTQATWRNANIDNSLYYDVDDAIRRGYIAYINNTEGSINTTTGDSDVTNEIKTWLETYGQYIDLWTHGHYHRKIGDEWLGRTRYAEKYGTRFLNCSVMNSVLHNYYNGDLEVKSNVLSISGNKMTIKTYVHYDPNSVISVGYYAPEEFEITLKRNFVR